MIEVSPNLFVGNATDCDDLPKDHDFVIIHAAKERWHRQALGYTTPGAPKDDPEYLWCYRNGNLILNIVDVADPRFIAKTMIDEAVKFARDHLAQGQKVLIHCNQGRSRSPTIAMLVLAPELPETFVAAKIAFRRIYPPHDPARGIHTFAKDNWSAYRGS